MCASFGNIVAYLNDKHCSSVGVKHQHADVSSLYTKLTIYTIVVWIVYIPIFALAEGTGIINPDGETIAYTVLDILGRTVFGIWLVLGHKHESEDAAVCLPEHWTEPRGSRRGVIQLPVSVTHVGMVVC